MKRDLTDELIEKLHRQIEKLDEKCDAILVDAKHHKENNESQQANECDNKYKQLKTILQNLNELII